MPITIPNIQIVDHPNIPGPLPHGVTAHTRTDGENVYLFVENYSGRKGATLSLGKSMENLLTGRMEQTIVVPPYSFSIYKAQ